MYSVDAWCKQSTEAEFSALQEHSNLKKKYKLRKKKDNEYLVYCFCLVLSLIYNRQSFKLMFFRKFNFKNLSTNIILKEKV